MKKIILTFLGFVFCLSLCSYAQAQTGAKRLLSVLGSGSAGGGADSCTGGLIFSWHFENSVTTTVGGGCSAGSTTATASGTPAFTSTAPEDGTYALDSASGYYTLPVSAGDIGNKNAGTMVFWVKIHTFSDTGGLFYIRYDSSSQIKVAMAIVGTKRNFSIEYDAGGSYAFANTVNTSDYPLDTWIKLTSKWSTAGVGGQYLYINANDDGYSGTYNSALGTMANTPNLLRIGYSAGNFYDNLKVYSSWQ